MINIDATVILLYIPVYVKPFLSVQSNNVEYGKHGFQAGLEIRLKDGSAAPLPSQPKRGILILQKREAIL